MSTVKTKAGKGKYHWDYQEFCYLVHVLEQTKDFKDTLNLFIDLHTTQEIAHIVRRVIMVSMLLEGSSYIDIADATGASASTISGLQRKLDRQKSVLAPVMAKAGTFDKFVKRSPAEKTQLGSLVDRMISRRSLGIFKSSR